MHRMFSVVALTLMFLSLSLASFADECEEMVVVKDNQGNVILTYQSLYMGTSPWKAFNSWDLNRYARNNFFKEIFVSSADSEIVFTRAYRNSPYKMTAYCTDEDGSVHTCGEFYESTRDFTSDYVALKSIKSNSLYPNQIVISQKALGHSQSTYNSHVGKTVNYTEYFLYRGVEYALSFCRRIQ